MKPTFTKKKFREIDLTKKMIDANCCNQALMLRMAVIYIVVNIIYVPASRLKSASTSTKLFASVRIKRPHKPQLTVNNLELPGIDTKVAASTKKNFWKINVQQVFSDQSMDNIIILSIHANDICIIFSSIIVRWVR